MGIEPTSKAFVPQVIHKLSPNVFLNGQNSQFFSLRPQLLTKAVLIKLFLDTWYEEQPRIKPLSLNRILLYWQLYLDLAMINVRGPDFTACTIIRIYYPV